ncbi:MAG: hypothetical protein ACJ79C_11975, partial [Myxococcales bacterium]
EGAADLLLGPTRGAGLESSVLGALSASLQSGLGIIFWTIAGIALAASAISLFFPHLPVTSARTAAGEVGQPAEMTIPPEA